VVISDDSQKPDSLELSNTEQQKQLLKRFGERVQSIRVKARLSQEQLSERVQLHRSYISDIERGIGNVSLSVLFRLAVALDVSLTSLLESADPRKLSSPYKLLMVDTGQPIEVLNNALKCYQVVVCKNLTDAVNALGRAKFDLIVTSLTFDDTSLFELLRQSRSNGLHRATPFICFWQPNSTPAAIKEAMEISLNSLGMTALIDIEKFYANSNLEQAIRAELELYLPGNSHSQV
jgi:transcriptional regulator with XRE-family HTH domain